MAVNFYEFLKKEFNGMQINIFDLTENKLNGLVDNAKYFVRKLKK